MAWEEDHVARITRRFVDRSAAIKALIRGELAKPTAQKWAKYLERAKRSGSEFASELSNIFQLLKALADFCVGRFVGRFIARVSMDEVFVNGSL